MKSENIPKLTYQPDLSEHCKRRAIPSVFLEEHARESASRTMLFSKSELPYSCFIIVKTESANDLLLVIQSVTLEDLEQSCVKDSDQLLIFEMGETFGGYWGPLLKSNFEFDKTTEPHTVYYTLKTTQETTEETQGQQSEEEEDVSTPPSDSDDSVEQIDKNAEDTGGKDMIVEEIPLVEFSGRAIPADKLWTPPGITEDPYDFDISPIKGKKYVTEVLPVVEIAMDTNSEKAREQYYKLDYDVDFTQRAKLKKYAAMFNRGRHRHTMHSRLFPKKLVTLMDEATAYEHQNKDSVATATTTPTHSWDHLMELVNRLESTTSKLITNATQNTNNKLEDEDDPEYSEFTESEITFNPSTFQTRSSLIDKSALAARKSDSTSKKLSTIQSTSAISKTITDQTISKNTEATIGNTISTYSTQSTGNNRNNIKHIQLTETSNDQTTILHNSGATVGHQSWENVVQAAPDIALILNQSTADIFESNTDDVTPKPKANKKRHIQAVDIKNARPHTFSSVSSQPTYSKGMLLDAANSYDLVKYVELGEDEIHGRAQLRYLRPYVGPIRYNICKSIEEPKQAPQKVHLFNSSRIVIAINNFTLKSMTLIASTVRLVPSSDHHCPSSHLECQVSGARVCVDTCVACDGVPNCGSYDTYDEDRHLCGGAPLPYNVYLAAFTFLAVLCTLLYIIHYWIKRCVPKVSDAFFVYTDGAENVLYLDTIMRSPNDTDDNKPYHGHIFDDDLPQYLLQHTERKSFFKSWIAKLNFLSRSKSRQTSAIVTEPEPAPQERSRMFSFQELEIRKMMKRDTTDEFIQTGPSLELENLPPAASKTPALAKDSESEESMEFVKMMSPNHNQELNILKLLQKERPPAGLITPRPSEIRLDARPTSPRRSAGTDEEELQTTFYEAQGVHVPFKDTMTYESINSYERRVREQPSTSSHARKRLRFEEGATAIPSASQDPLDDDEEARKIYPKKSEDTRGANVRETGPKDFMWFWTGSKNKKHKKKLAKTNNP